MADVGNYSAVSFRGIHCQSELTNWQHTFPPHSLSGFVKGCILKSHCEVILEMKCFLAKCQQCHWVNRNLSSASLLAPLCFMSAWENSVILNASYKNVETATLQMKITVAEVQCIIKELSGKGAVYHRKELTNITSWAGTVILHFHSLLLRQFKWKYSSSHES